jgi:hypothetical protein
MSLCRLQSAYEGECSLLDMGIRDCCHRIVIAATVGGPIPHLKTRERLWVNAQILIRPLHLRYERVDGRQIACRLEREGDAMPEGLDSVNIFEAGLTRRLGKRDLELIIDRFLELFAEGGSARRPGANSVTEARVLGKASFSEDHGAESQNCVARADHV